MAGVGHAARIREWAEVLDLWLAEDRRRDEQDRQRAAQRAEMHEELMEWAVEAREAEERRRALEDARLAVEREAEEADARHRELQSLIGSARKWFMDGHLAETPVAHWPQSALQLPYRIGALLCPIGRSCKACGRGTKEALDLRPADVWADATRERGHRPTGGREYGGSGKRYGESWESRGDNWWREQE